MEFKGFAGSPEKRGTLGILNLIITVILIGAIT